MPRTAQVKRDARIGEAEARRDAGIKVREIDFIYVTSAVIRTIHCFIAGLGIFSWPTSSELKFCFFSLLVAITVSNYQAALNADCCYRCARCLSVCHMAELGFTVRDHSVQPLPNHFGFLFYFSFTVNRVSVYAKQKWTFVLSTFHCYHTGIDNRKPLQRSNVLLPATLMTLRLLKLSETSSSRRRLSTRRFRPRSHSLIWLTAFR